MQKEKTMLIAAVLVIVVVLSIFVAVWAVYMRPSPTQPLVEVASCYISPSSIRVDQTAFIASETESRDEENYHTIVVQFSIEPTELINFTTSMRSTLVHTSNYVWQYSYSLYPLGIYSDATILDVSLPSGYTSANYEVQVTFLMDGSPFASRTLNLTVNSS